LSLLAESAKAANGNLTIESNKAKGTKIKATFQHSHIDRRPLGDMKQTIISLVLGNPEIDLIYHHTKDRKIFMINTKEIKSQLKEIPIHSMAGIKAVREDLKRLQSLLQS
jgi:hypothetical protein